MLCSSGVSLKRWHTNSTESIRELTTVWMSKVPLFYKNMFSLSVWTIITQCGPSTRGELYCNCFFIFQPEHMKLGLPFLIWWKDLLTGYCTSDDGSGGSVESRQFRIHLLQPNRLTCREGVCGHVQRLKYISPQVLFLNKRERVGFLSARLKSLFRAVSRQKSLKTPHCHIPLRPTPSAYNTCAHRCIHTLLQTQVLVHTQHIFSLAHTPLLTHSITHPIPHIWTLNSLHTHHPILSHSAIHSLTLPLVTVNLSLSLILSLL